MAEIQQNLQANEYRYPETNVELHVANVREIEQLFADEAIETPVTLFHAEPESLKPGIESLDVRILPHETDSAFGMSVSLARSIRMDLTLAESVSYTIDDVRRALRDQLKLAVDEHAQVTYMGFHAGLSFDQIGRDQQIVIDMLTKLNTISLRGYAFIDGSEASNLYNKQILDHFYMSAMIITNKLLHPGPDQIRILDRPTISLDVPAPELIVEKIAEQPVTMDSLGGLGSAKERLREIKEVMEDPEMAIEYGLEQKPALLLLHGRPGVGKTTLIKAFASEIGAQLITVKAVDIIDKWIGSSARNLMPHFQGAIEASKNGPVVLFFKEMDTMIAKDAGNSNEHTQLLGAFKSAIDEINDLGPEHRLIMLADTNADLDSLDAAMIRPGRFETVSCNLPSAAERREIWQSIIATEEMKRLERTAKTAQTTGSTPDVFDLSLLDNPDSAFSSDVNINELVDRTDSLSGADFQGIIKSIRLAKLRRAKGAKALGEQPAGQVAGNQITQTDLLRAIADFGKK